MSRTVLVTRPAPDNERTAQVLRASGYDVLLAPLMQFEALRVADDVPADIDGVIITSANALRAIAGDALLAQLRQLPLFVVGERTADLARKELFCDVRSISDDASGLIDAVATQMPGSRMLYLAGEDVSRDIASELAAKGATIEQVTTYRMTQISVLLDDVRHALLHGQIDAVLHYSRRSARLFIDLARTQNLTDAALSAPQYCLSPTVAEVLRAAGAQYVIASPVPREQNLLEMLDRTFGQKHE